MDFTVDDINTLIEAVGEWETAEGKDYMLEMSVISQVAPTSDEMRRMLDQKHKQEKADLLEAVRLRQEQGILLKARLIQWRDSIEVEEFSTARGWE